MENDIKKSIEKGIAFLFTVQETDGSYVSLSSKSKNFKNPLAFHSVFASTLILQCINEMPKSEKTKVVSNRLANFLLSQKSRKWSFNYWARNSQEYRTIPYPDDLDDTFCALAALYKYDVKIFNGRAIKSIMSILTTCEKRVGGPYKTWLVGEKAERVWKDVDIAVNANIAYFLSLLDIELPNLSKLFKRHAKEERLTSPYYPEHYPVIYFISRFVKANKTLYVKLLNSKKTTNPLNAALRILSFFNMGEVNVNLKTDIECVLNDLKKEECSPYPFYTGVNPKRDANYYAGSKPLTTAYCILALSRYLEITKGNTNTLQDDTKKLQHTIIQRAKKGYPHGKMGATAVRLTDKIIQENSTNQITLISQFFYTSLGVEKKKIDREFIVQLGVANLYGWMAYTIYDNILDTKKDIELLPLANILARKSFHIFENVLPENSSYKNMVRKIFITIDSANYLEKKATKKINDIADYKWGNYSSLANKSIGHAIGPLAMLFKLGHGEKSLDVKNMQTFFKHYIIARQLNDDAHDWEEDLEEGNITPVLSKIFKQLKKDTYKKENLQKIFWYKTIIEVSQEVLHHLHLARKALAKIDVIEDKTHIEELLKPIERSIEKVLLEQKRTTEFLEVY